MAPPKLSNISLRDFRRALEQLGCTPDTKRKGRGGHEYWRHPKATRPIVLQTHESPVPLFIVRNILRDIGVSKDELWEVLKK